MAGRNYQPGSSQNVGNHIRSTPSTRVNAPPGGVSTFSFAYEEPCQRSSQRTTQRPGGFLSWEEGTGAQTRSYDYSHQAKQAFWGSKSLEDEAAPLQQGTNWESSVHEYRRREQCSDIFCRDERSKMGTSQQNDSQGCRPSSGGFETGPGGQVGPNTPRRSRQSDFGGSDILRWDAGERQHCAPRQGQKEMTFGARIEGSSNLYANGAHQNCGNGLADRPTTRVKSPPGGVSSVQFG